MRIVSLQFHDVIAAGDCDASGFPGPGPASYKLDSREFERQCAQLSAISGARPATVLEALSASQAGRDSFLITFDDGGISACGPILKLLDRYGWKAHFFVATDYIGKPGFLTKTDIKMLRERGHVVGSHSCSHPQRMSHQTWEEVREEWTASVGCLADILREEVTTASVPHGYYSRTVAEAASLGGIRALFTSEPVRSTHRVSSCEVFGRYVVRPGTDPALIVRLVRGQTRAWCKEFLFWNAKKIAKLVGGQAYLKLRAQVLHHSTR
jgi:peptidoglycan/xylan/chitin deacetylase (PgdA/CDA1 family)